MCKCSICRKLYTLFWSNQRVVLISGNYVRILFPRENYLYGIDAITALWRQGIYHFYSVIFQIEDLEGIPTGYQKPTLL